MKKFAAFAVVFATFISLCGRASAEPIIIGRPSETSNCFPFGCGGQFGPSTRYQQIYSSTAFAGPLLIREIQFYAHNPSDSLLNIGRFEFYLSTTGKSVDGLNTANFDENVGADAAFFTVVPFSGGPPPSVLRIAGASFFYDPTAGNLLLDIKIPDGARHAPGSSAFFDSRTPESTPHVFSRAHNFGQGTSGFGLVTGFFDSAAAVPEPSSLLLIATGFFALRRWKESTSR